MGARNLLLAGCLALPAWTWMWAAKDPPFQHPQPAATYAARDAHEGVTVAADPYDTPEKSKKAFGKYDPLKIGVLPVYVVITNSTGDALRLDALEAQFVAADRDVAEPIPAGTVSLRVKGQKPPRLGSKPNPSPLPRLPERYDPSAIAVIVDQEFVLKMVPPGETVGGFLFFDIRMRRNVLSGARLYLTHVTWARTGKDLLFFEVNFDDYLKGK